MQLVSKPVFFSVFVTKFQSFFPGQIVACLVCRHNGIVRASEHKEVEYVNVRKTLGCLGRT